jgi:hypothetical protein
MTPRQCAREAEVVEVVSSGRWPEQVCSELREHVRSCSICSDVLTVAQAMHDDYAAAAPDVRLPSAGLVWWRAELRARREAVRTAERPLTLVHALAGAATIGVLAAVLSLFSPLAYEFFARITGMMPDSPAALLQQHVPLTLMLGAFLVLAPVALYFVFSDK